MNFLCKVVPAGRAFRRRLIEATKRIINPNFFIDISAQMRKDLHWWTRFLPLYNGVLLFQDLDWSDAHDLRIECDASTTVGGGACFGKQWFFEPWAGEQRSWDINALELYVILLACTT